MSFKSDEDATTKAVKECKIAQMMIDLNAKHLEGLRTQCSMTQNVTQQEIQQAETKLVKLFSNQLVAKARLARNSKTSESQLSKYPKTDQWLKIVGIPQNSILGVTEKGHSLEEMIQMSSWDIMDLLKPYNVQQDECVKLTSALKNLRNWTDKQLSQDMKIRDNDVDLHWTSYKLTNSSPYSGTSPKMHRDTRPSTSSLPPDTYFNAQHNQDTNPTPPHSTPASPTPFSPSRRKGTPPPTPPLVRPKKFPTTPPPKKKMQLFPEAYSPNPLKKSKSHESQLGNRVVDTDVPKMDKKKPTNLNLSSDTLFQNRRRSAEGESGNSRGPSGCASPNTSSPIRSPPYQQPDQYSLNDDMYQGTKLLVPKSPRTPVGNRSMLHSISHRFQQKLVMGTCEICNKHVLIGKICKYCKYKCHKDCASKAAPACGLPPEFIDHFMNTFRESPDPQRRVGSESGFPIITKAVSVPAFQDSGSTTSSCNSSTPSSPVFAITTSTSATASSPAHMSASPATNSAQKFNFPELGNHILIDAHGGESRTETLVNTNTSNTSNDSDKTLVDSNNSEKTLPDRVDSIDSTEESLNQSWHRQNSISVALKEWDIPYEDLQFDSIVGKGRFGTVFKGNWHGDVAIKMFDIDTDTKMEQQAAFKMEVSMLKKTRHENLVLFMGACMKTPHLGIVTSYCKLSTLHTHIHQRRESFPMNRTVIISSQIAQGMGYLHARGIVHKDLKSKNIFLESGKVVITDYGLFNFTKLCHDDRHANSLHIPPGWLCYLAPEIMHSLRPGKSKVPDEVPFSTHSDVYAFGTVWYELLTGEWPFRSLPPEAIIWQVGKGIKQSLASMQASRDVKDILMLCWSFKPTDRQDFVSLQRTLERLPKKRLARSPSHPVHLSRSAESVF
ncbi:unnamed protein product [Owenia fusiformis]|uniref:Uncharacterized protein n=1 Tax=Owenia fusiformis TaxID=6347 RepID=A0A8J1TK64_OWEFU|nr:unnamed protein product [Owenia fusiformis]